MQMNYISSSVDETLLYRQVNYTFYEQSQRTSRIEHKNGTIIYRTKHLLVCLMYFRMINMISFVVISVLFSRWSNEYSYRIPMISLNIDCSLPIVVHLCVSIVKYHLAIDLLVLSNICSHLFGSISGHRLDCLQLHNICNNG
jgi:hypothetical protein